MRAVPSALALCLGLMAAGCGEKTDDSAKAADSVTAAPADTTAAPKPDSTVAVKPPAPPKTEHVVKVKEHTPGLLAQAKVVPLDAQHTAQTKFPLGIVKSGEILRRSNQLVYAFDIQQEGATGTEEVFVNAMDGNLISSVHKDPVAKKTAPKKKAPAKKKP